MAMNIERAHSLDAVFSALGNPTRRAIVARLARGDASVLELSEPFGVSQPTISKHLKVLEDAGLIETARDAQRRPRRLRATAIKEVADWIEPYRKLWERRLDNLDRHLAKKKREER
jgi:DNA-binding transcriptional ArsR family regulator